MRDDLISRLGDEIGTWLAKRVGKAVKGIDMSCSNNFRVALKDDPEQVAKYEAQKEGGCCAFFDQEFHHFKSAKIILVGFNYGH